MNSVNPYQTAPSGPVWYGSALYAYAILSKTLMFEILEYLLYEILEYLLYEILEYLL